MGVEENKIWGCKRFQSNEEDVVVYCSVERDEHDVEAYFAILMPEPEPDGSEMYRVKVEGNVGAAIGKYPDTVLININKGVFFADFYTETGEIVKQMLKAEDGKFYKLDDEAYYEVTCADKAPGEFSTETYVGRDENHRYHNKELVDRKRKFVRMFLEMFEALR